MGTDATQGGDDGGPAAVVTADDDTEQRALASKWRAKIERNSRGRPSSMQLSAVSQAIVAARSFLRSKSTSQSNVGGDGTSSAPTADQGSADRLSVFLEVLNEIVTSEEGDEAVPTFGEVMQKVVVEDMKLSKSDVSRIISWFEEVKSMAENHPNVMIVKEASEEEHFSSAGGGARPPLRVLITTSQIMPNSELSHRSLFPTIAKVILFEVRRFQS